MFGLDLKLMLLRENNPSVWLEICKRLRRFQISLGNHGRTMKEMEWSNSSISVKSKGTMIGKTVNVFQKHAVKEIREVARLLIRTWRGKVDEWVQVQNRDAEARLGEFDESSSFTLNEEAPAALSSSAELLRIFHGVDQTGLNIAEKRGAPIKLNPAEHAITDKMRVEDLSWNSRNPWQLLGGHDAQKNSQDLICQHALGSHEGKDVSGKGLAEKQKVKQVKMNMNTFSRDKESEEATMELRIPSLPKMIGVAKYKQCVGNEGTMRDQTSAVKFGVSTLQHRPVVPTWVEKSAHFGQNLQMSNTSRQPLFFMQQCRMQLSEYGMLQKVAERGRKPREQYLNAEDEKQHAIQVIDANDPCANQQHKRFRLYDARKN